MTPEQFVSEALQAGCPTDQVENLVHAIILLQPRQLLASAAARLCDQPHGPTMIGYGGARGGGKSYWLMAQMGADDCQRFPGLKCLLLRKSNKSNKENLEDLRKKVFAHLKHTFNATTGVLQFDNGSSILAKHYQHEREIDSFLGLEYDVIGIEEATTLTARKWNDIQTCSRTSKPWRPRIYSTTNPGGVGHHWYRDTFILPFFNKTESKTRFIPARLDDNPFTNPEYREILAQQTGWRKRAWCDGDWDIASGQFFSTFRHDVHVLADFNESNAVEWFAAMDYGYTHNTVVLLGCLDSYENIYIVDEFVGRHLVPQRIVASVKEMLFRHKIPCGPDAIIKGPPLSLRDPNPPPAHYMRRRLDRFVAGGDLFSKQFDGSTLNSHFSGLGSIRPANTDRVQGWAEILHRLGDPDVGITPTLYFHKRCERLLACLPYLQHDPDHPADVLKSNINEEGLGGDDAADALRYLLATKPRRLYVTRLRGL